MIMLQCIYLYSRQTPLSSKSTFFFLPFLSYINIAVHQLYVMEASLSVAGKLVGKEDLTASQTSPKWCDQILKHRLTDD